MSISAALRVSVGIFAHNEGRNILHCLDSVAFQHGKGMELDEIIVVSSSEDGTDDKVRGYALRDGRVRLLVKPRRGKSDAVNTFLSEARSEIVVLVNADNILEPGSLAELIAPFSDAEVGIVGGHPVPINPRSSLIGYAVNMLWSMHHHISKRNPKTGELVAMRDLGLQIDLGVNTDEDWLRMSIERKGFEVRYAERAVVRNKGATNLTDFMQQRVRVNVGEVYMKRRYGFTPPTWDQGMMLAALRDFMIKDDGSISKMLISMALEAMARVYAKVYVFLDRGDMYIWNAVESTKDLN